MEIMNQQLKSTSILLGIMPMESTFFSSNDDEWRKYLKKDSLFLRELKQIEQNGLAHQTRTSIIKFG